MSPAAQRHSFPVSGGASAARGRALGLAHQRLAIGVILFIGLVLVIALRLVDLAVFDGPPRHRGMAAHGTEMRADIVDRHGTVLATSFRAFALAAHPYDIVGNRDALANQLAQILPDRPRARIRASLDGPGKFHFVSRRILPEQAEKIRHLGEPGLTIERETERLYPNLNMAAHLIGYTGIDGRGEGGIERAFNDRLADPDQLEKPLVLAMDARVQQALESELAAQIDKSVALGGAGVVMDARTGEVLAMSSLPSFNANRPTGLVGMQSHMNRATLGVYELGSVFKPLTVAMALETGAITDLGERFSTSPMRAGRRTISDDHRKPYPLSVPEVLIYSSNVGAAQIALRLGGAKQQEFLKKLGLEDRAPGELLEAGRPLLPPKGNWGDASIMTVSYGHGIAVTPLHLAAAYATLVNGGVRHPTTFLKVTKKPAGTRVFSERTSHLVNGMMRLIVLDGTGRFSDVPGYRVGGKTGTAEKTRPDGRGYLRHHNITTFAGAFPMDDPRYVVVITVDDPSVGSRYAASVSGPVFKNVVQRIAPMLGVAPDLAKEPDLTPYEGLYTPRKAPKP